MGNKGTKESRKPLPCLRRKKCFHIRIQAEDVSSVHDEENTDDKVSAEPSEICYATLDHFIRGNDIKGHKTSTTTIYEDVIIIPKRVSSSSFQYNSDYDDVVKD
ncbi:uncharacterized protein LOC144327483 [Podarcis muralis]